MFTPCTDDAVFLGDHVDSKHFTRHVPLSLPDVTITMSPRANMPGHQTTSEARDTIFM